MLRSWLDAPPAQPDVLMYFHNSLNSLSVNFRIMTRQAIIERTLKAINQLPEEKAEEISDFADFVIKRYEEQRLTEGISQLTANSQAFDFLNDEEDLYSEADLKQVYNG
jgi:hypothetical protein